MRILIWTARRFCKGLETYFVFGYRWETGNRKSHICSVRELPQPVSQVPSLDIHDTSALPCLYLPEEVSSMFDRLLRLGSKSGLSLGFVRSTDNVIKAFICFCFFFLFAYLD